MTIAGRKVIVVEDDDSMREAIGRLLGAAGSECVAYASAEALLESGIDESAACFVSDLMLPAMSGLDLLDELHTRGVLAPLILITAHDEPGRREEAVRRGVTTYLVKPFRGTALLEAIECAVQASDHGDAKP
jgi:FixJ family two-component response regulator